jgi:peptidoglycan L-alanyl-D-glutamate endopeptidase CwlK
MDLLYPPFLEALLNLQMECRLLGSSYKIYSGHRPFDEQRVLYEKYLAGGPKAAPAGLSAHNYGLAVDCARLLPSGKLSWDSADYKILEDTVEKHGLITGKSFNDQPHVQWPNVVSGKELWPLKIAYSKAPGSETEKLKVVWDGL